MITDRNNSEVLGINFFECVTDNVDRLSNLLSKMGFEPFAQHLTEPMLMFRQNNIYCIVHEAIQGYAKNFFKEHGSSICSIGFEITNHPQEIVNRARNLGYETISDDSSTITGLYGIVGVGKTIIYLTSKNKLLENFLVFPEFIERENEASKLTIIDHVAMNVFPGQTKEWIQFYKEVFNFHELNKFEIEGRYTSFRTRSMGNISGSIKLVISESEDSSSQISEYLNEHNGAGIQHLAFSTEDIYSSVDVIRKNNIPFMPIPDSYYQKINQRLPHHKENIKDLQSRRILIDGNCGDKPNILLQIFTKCLIGPIFFEVIQRKGNNEFGAGNIKALFEAVEQDQVERNMLKVKKVIK